MDLTIRCSNTAIITPGPWTMEMQLKNVENIDGILATIINEFGTKAILETIGKEAVMKYYGLMEAE